VVFEVEIANCVCNGSSRLPAAYEIQEGAEARLATTRIMPWTARCLKVLAPHDLLVTHRLGDLVAISVPHHQVAAAHAQFSRDVCERETDRKERTEQHERSRCTREMY
jgi:hypothetical protein